MQKFSKFQKSLFTSTLYKFQGALEGILAPIFHVHKHTYIRSLMNFSKLCIS